ncbi:hypothetical protein CSPHI_05080 [Corynebacterium sphenisci DSM 44792]|uniref:DUF4185 domain-containing protein n=1 Tax=Corynebacterium sphenisci DSM 44792 TaxID=1437874 RepID=A0A1L7CXH3_9CORY|nr:DUF4185 domain-containing protein [Corynebacterium sphenisci]APT90511.1 hypothetical protein CSPHI_05080 [Corynebacterium sphenisci DSM 44792]
MHRIQVSAGHSSELAGTNPAARPTAGLGVVGTDLGFLFEGGRQDAPPGQSSLWVGGLFGDTFTTDSGTCPVPAGTDRHWRSPVMCRTSNRDFLDRGIVWDNAAGAPTGEGMATQLWGYEHIGEAGVVDGRSFDCFTIIPNDAIQLPNGIYVGCGFRVRRWLDAPTADGRTMCETLSNSWWWSQDPHAEVWQPCRHADDLAQLYEWAAVGRDGLFQNTTLIQPAGDDHVYCLGTPGGRKAGGDSGIYLRRADWRRLCDDRAWEFWGWRDGRWQWGRDVWPTPILRPATPRGPIGEINAQVIAGTIVLTYVDITLGAVAVTAPAPDAPWTAPVVLVPRRDLCTLYAPSVHPWSSLDDAFMHLSAWTRTPGRLGGVDLDEVPVDYCAYSFRGSLLAEDPVTVTESPRAMGLDTSAMTDFERADTLARIAAACDTDPGSTP